MCQIDCPRQVNDIILERLLMDVERETYEANKGDCLYGGNCSSSFCFGLRLDVLALTEPECFVKKTENVF